jgi:hypothetical protein
LWDILGHRRIRSKIRSNRADSAPNLIDFERLFACNNPGRAQKRLAEGPADPRIHFDPTAIEKPALPSIRARCAQMIVRAQRPAFPS